MRTSVFDGDITKVPSDALITAVNSSQMWFGGIDGAIQGCAGNMFHGQAARTPLIDGEAYLTPALAEHRGRFGSVLFVVDDLKRPLREIVGAGLLAAEKHKFTRVSLPTLRTGVMAGAYEPTVQAALDETVAAVEGFKASGPWYLQELTVVVYRDPQIQDYLEKAFASV